MIIINISDTTWAVYQRIYRDPVFTGSSPTTAQAATAPPWTVRNLPNSPGSPTPLSLNQAELPIATPTELNPAPASILSQASQQPMPDHLTHTDRMEIELLLLRIFPRDHDAIAFLAEHNHGLRAKPLDLIARNQAGVEQLLAYLRQAAEQQPPLDPITRMME